MCSSCVRCFFRLLRSLLSSAEQTSTSAPCAGGEAGAVGAAEGGAPHGGAGEGVAAEGWAVGGGSEEEEEEGGGDGDGGDLVFFSADFPVISPTFRVISCLN